MWQLYASSPPSLLWLRPFINSFFNLSSDPRGTHLWEFIRDILLNPDKNPGLIKWEDRSEGIFRFLKSEAVAQLWGKKKNNSSMTYEKLSRAMRWGVSSPDHHRLFPLVVFVDGHLMWCPLLQILLQKRNSGTCRWKKTRIQIWEECTWMARKWKLNLPTLSTNPNIPPNDSQQRAPGHKYFKDYFSLIFMYLEGENHLLLMGRRNTTVDKIVTLKYVLYGGQTYTVFCEIWCCMWSWFVFASIVKFLSMARRAGFVALCFLLKEREKN